MLHAHVLFSRPFRGVAAVMVGAGPAHAFYFATYEHSKQVMSNVLPQYNHFNYGKLVSMCTISGLSIEEKRTYYIVIQFQLSLV